MESNPIQVDLGDGPTYTPVDDFSTVNTTITNEINAIETALTNAGVSFGDPNLP